MAGRRRVATAASRAGVDRKTPPLCRRGRGGRVVPRRRLSAAAARALQPAGLHPGQGVPRQSRGSGRALYSVPEHLLGSSLDARVDSQRGSSPRFAPSSRHKEGDDQQDPGEVSETAMRLHRAHPEVVLGGLEAGRVVVPIEPLAAPRHHGPNIVAPRVPAVSTTTAVQPHRGSRPAARWTTTRTTPTIPTAA